MAYANYGRRNYNNGNQGYNNYQQNNNNYQPQNKPPFDLTQFVNQRLDVYDAFIEAIAARGKEPSDYAFALGGWVTSAVMKQEGK